jgi:hypothetical protein
MRNEPVGESVGEGVAEKDPSLPAVPAQRAVVQIHTVEFHNEVV